MIFNFTWFIFVAVVVSCFVVPALLLEIKAFQPAVVPIRAVTTLTLQTDAALNVTVNSSLQCRFKDVSVSARLEDGFVFCDTPPMRNIDKVSLYLDVDGRLFKTKKPLYFHEPFKVSNVTPSVVSPAQSLHLTVNRITCQEWMQYFVRFQTANGTKKTQQGICKNSVVTCFVPEFPPNTRLRVGLTLSNRLVEWADKKILIQYPVDALRSSVRDVEIDTSRKGAFSFRVILKDRFENPIGINKKEKGKLSRISVQYSTQNKPKLLRFLKCSTTIETTSVGSKNLLICTGAEGENIFFYPSINNVPLGGQEKYEAQTTLCPGKSSCIASESFPVVIVAIVSGAVVLVVLLLIVTVFFLWRGRRYMVERTRQETLGSSNDLEMEIQPPENCTGFCSEYTHEEIVHPEETCAFAYDEGETPNSATSQEEAADADGNRAIKREPAEDDHRGNSEGSLRIEAADAPRKHEIVELKTLKPKNDKEGQLSEGIQMAGLEVKNPIPTTLATVQEIIDRLYREANPGTKQGTKNKQTDLLKEMDEIIEEIEPFCNQEETTAAIQKVKEASQLLSSQQRKTEGHDSLLFLIEELQGNVADLEKALKKVRA